MRSIRSLACAFGLLATVSLAQQESPQELRRQIQAVEKEIARERDLHAQEQKRAQDFAASSKDKLRSIDEQARIVRSQIDSLRSEMTRIEEARKAADGTARHFVSRKEKFRETVAKAADSLANVIAADFPVRSAEHVAAAKELAAGLRAGSIGSEDGLSRLWDLLLERVRIGYTVESWSGYLDLEGRNLSGKYLRYGAVAAAFVTNDGSQVYLLEHSKDGYAWKGLGEDITMRARIKDALQVSEGRTAPRLVEMPFAGGKP